jgi:hypothetical protein
MKRSVGALFSLFSDRPGVVLPEALPADLPFAGESNARIACFLSHRGIMLDVAEDLRLLSVKDDAIRFSYSTAEDIINWSFVFAWCFVVVSLDRVKKERKKKVECVWEVGYGIVC